MGHAARMLHIDDISYSIQGRPLFAGASASVPEGHKVGLVGPNGAGKTTLFKLIRGELGLDGGAISLPTRARIGGVAQESAATALSVLETVLEADQERTALMAESLTATDAHRIADIQTRSWQAGGGLPAAVLDSLVDGAVQESWAVAITMPPSPRHRVLVAVADGVVVGFAATLPASDPDSQPAVRSVRSSRLRR